MKQIIQAGTHEEYSRVYGIQKTTLDLWCWTPLSIIIFQLYRSGQLYWSVSNHWQSLSYNECCTPRHKRDSNFPLYVSTFQQHLHMEYDLSWSKIPEFVVPIMQDFVDRELLLTRKMPAQGFLLVNLKTSLRKFYGRHHDLVNSYGIVCTESFLIHDIPPDL